MLLVHTYDMCFEGKGIESHPAVYCLWDRVKAWVTRSHLPEIVVSDRLTVTIRIQGPCTEFIADELKARRNYYLECCRWVDPKAECLWTVLVCQGKAVSQRPCRDRSRGQSDTYQRWLSGFSCSESCTPMEDRKYCR